MNDTALKLSLKILRDKLDKLRDVLILIERVKRSLQKKPNSGGVSIKKLNIRNLVDKIQWLFKNLGDIRLGGKYINKLKKLIKRLKAEERYLRKKEQQLLDEHHKNKSEQVLAEINRIRREYEKIREVREELNRNLEKLKKSVETKREALQKKLENLRVQIVDLKFEIEQLKIDIERVDRIILEKLPQFAERAVPLIQRVNKKYGTSISPAIVGSFLQDRGYLMEGAVPPKSSEELSAKFGQYFDEKVDLLKLTVKDKTELKGNLERDIANIAELLLGESFTEKSNLKEVFREKKELHSQLERESNDLSEQVDKLGLSDKVLLRETKELSSPEIKKPIVEYLLEDESFSPDLMNLADDPDDESFSPDLMNLADDPDDESFSPDLMNLTDDPDDESFSPDLMGLADDPDDESFSPNLMDLDDDPDDEPKYNGP